MEILLVEDNEDDVFAFKYALKKTGLEVSLQVARSGKEAKEILSSRSSRADRQGQEESPLTVFMDLKLPYMSGIEVLAWMRDQPALKGVRVITLSGSDEARDHRSVEQLGAADYLVKPPSPEDLLRLLKPAGPNRF